VDIRTSEKLDAFLSAEVVDYIIVDADMVNRRPMIAKYLTIFTQLLGPNWQLHGQMDRQPVSGQWPTSRCQPGQRFVDKFVVRVSETASVGEYLVLVGLYDLTTGQRLPVVAGGEQLPDDAVVLHRFYYWRMEGTSSR
jgi:hypothetical protein